MKNNWSIKKLGEVAFLINGRAFKSSEWSTTGLPIIRIKNLNDEKAKFNYFNGAYERNIYIDKGDLLFSWSGNLGTSFGPHLWKHGPGLLNQHIYKVLIKNNLLIKEFLYHYLKQITSDIEDRTHGVTGLVHVTKSELNKTEILLPSLNEQEKIVAKLEKTLSKIQEAKKLRLESALETNQLRASLQSQVFVDLKCKKVLLKEVCRYEGGTQPPKSIFVYEQKEGYIRLLQIRDYKSNDKAVYIPVSERHKECSKTDIMIGRYGPPVFQILKGKTGAYNVALMKCIPDNVRLSNDWLYHFLRSKPIQEYVISRSMRVRQAGVRPDVLDTLEIPLPDLKEQKKIVEYLDSLSEKVQNLERLQEEQLSELDALKASVLHQAFQGKL